MCHRRFEPRNHFIQRAVFDPDNVALKLAIATIRYQHGVLNIVPAIPRRLQGVENADDFDRVTAIDIDRLADIGTLLVRE